MKKLAGSMTVLAAIAITALGCSSTTTQPEAQPRPVAQAAPAATPAPAARTAAPAQRPAPIPPGRYTVVAGDHLWGISSRAAAYGNPQEWPLLYKANADKIEDADLIYPGQVLVIEKEPAAAQVEAAIKHARTRGQWRLGVVEQSDRVYLAAAK
jgi:nucleoid-associated protein YgaU